MPEYNVLSFDKIISYPLARKIVPFLRNTLDLTPNGITLINFCIRLLVLYYFYNIKEYNLTIGILCALTQIIDCFDGQMSRQYEMGTKYGKKLDLYLDLVFLTILVYLLVKFHNINLSTVFYFLLIYLISYKIYLVNRLRLGDYIEMNMPVLMILLSFILKNK